MPDRGRGNRGLHEDRATDRIPSEPVDTGDAVLRWSVVLSEGARSHQSLLPMSTLQLVLPEAPPDVQLARSPLMSLLSRVRYRIDG